MGSFLNLLIYLIFWSPGVVSVPGSASLNLREGCREVMVCTGVGDSAPRWRKTLGAGVGELNSVYFNTIFFFLNSI